MEPTDNGFVAKLIISIISIPVILVIALVEFFTLGIFIYFPLSLFGVDVKFPITTMLANWLEDMIKS